MRLDLKGKLLLVVLPGLILVSTVGIFWVEGSAENAFGSLFNSFWWTIVTFTTVGYGDMAPTTVSGRLFGVLILATGVTLNAIIISLVSNLFFEFQSGRERGLSSFKWKDHTLIGSDSPAFMQSVLEQLPPSSLEQGQVVLIYPKDEHPLLSSARFKGLDWVSGIAYQTDVLQRASVASAKGAFIAYEDDSYTLMSVMQMETLSNGRVNTVAQYHGGDFRIHLGNVGCDYALNTNDLYIPMMLGAYREQGTSTWLQELLLEEQDHATLRGEGVPAGAVGQTWLDHVCASKEQTGSMPIAVLLDDHVQVNPPADLVLTPEMQVFRVQPSANSLGQEISDARPFSGSAELMPTGHLIICSDRAVFIQRLLQEMTAAALTDQVVVISETENVCAVFPELNIEWISLPSTSEQAFRQARAQEGRVAFIDNQHDGNTLVAVLRMEQVTNGDIFSIASYREADFDQQLTRAGCDFCIHAESLVAPMLVQAVEQVPLATTLEQIISFDPASESLFVRELRADWSSKSWLETIKTIKEKTDQLPVGLIRTMEDEPHLLTNPRADVTVEAGDKLLFLARPQVAEASEFYGSGAGVPSVILEEMEGETEEPQLSAEEWFRLGAGKMKDPEENSQREAFRAFQRAALLGHPKAQYNLGVMNFHGKSVPKNRDEAYYWLREAATNGHPQAKKTIQSFRVLQKEMESSEEQRPLNPELLGRLSDLQRFWYMQAVVKMVMADGRIDLYERIYLHNTVRVLKDSKQIQALEEMIVFGPKGELPELAGLEEELQRMMLRELAEIAVVEQELSPEEVDFLGQVAQKIGAESTMLNQAVDYAKQRLQQFRSRR